MTTLEKCRLRPTPVSEQLTKVRLYELVVKGLEREVIEGRLNAGDRLPSEYELAERFGVSRTAIREAVKALVEQGMVVVKPGSGTYVAGDNQRPLQRSLSWLARIQGQQGDGYLLELRQVLEPEVCALAAQRATPEQLEQMRLAIADSERARGEPEAFVDADLRFHRLIGEASQNPLINALLDSLGDLLREQRIRYISVSGAPQRALKHHRAIFVTMEQGDPEGALRAMKSHIQQIHRDVQKAHKP
jgi:GntR family transcriptional regulator, transcriptional repressor for pyruvate dehydrogenase complex